MGGDDVMTILALSDTNPQYIYISPAESAITDNSHQKMIFIFQRDDNLLMYSYSSVIWCRVDYRGCLHIDNARPTIVQHSGKISYFLYI